MLPHHCVAAGFEQLVLLHVMMSVLQTPAAASSASNVQRGKDGHLTLGLSNDDFFKDPLASRGGSGKGSALFGSGGSGTFGGVSGPGMGPPKPVEVEPVAQKRFAGAKAISSRYNCSAGGNNHLHPQRIILLDSRLWMACQVVCLHVGLYTERMQG